MALFERTLMLLAAAVVLLHVARHFKLPYPAILALAGCGVAALPFTPQIGIEPHLALALFVAPAVLDSAFDLPPRELAKNWLPLTSLAVLLVLATTAAVAWAGHAIAGMPLAAALAMGAIVAPPDAAAASAILRQFDIPRRTMVVLQGESLLNDAVALLLFGIATTAAMQTGNAWTHAVPTLIVAVPAGALLGVALGAAFVYIAGRVAGTLSAVIVQFTVTYGAWIIAERLGLSAISAVVALAMVAARHLPARTRANDRINASAVWGSSVFVLNVLAFLLMGLQARSILSRLDGEALLQALSFSAWVLAIVIGVRLAWVLAYGLLLRRFTAQVHRVAPKVFVPSARIQVLVSWCGMRGLVTLATAFALPDNFPQRDLIVLTAFSVVLGTLVLQGLSMRPLIALLNLPMDRASLQQANGARAAMLHAAIQVLGSRDDAVSADVRAEYQAALDHALGNAEGTPSAHNRVRLHAIHAQRKVLREWRRHDRIDEDTYHRLERELDWAELSASRSADVALVEG